jgi:hypothetical protein
MNDDDDDDDGHGDNQVLKLEKEEREKKRMAQGKGIFNRSILFCHSKHQVSVSGFRIDSRTIKRGESRLKQLSNATR